MSFLELQTHISEQPLLWLSLAIVFGLFVGVRIGRWLERSRRRPHVALPETNIEPASEQEQAVPVSPEVLPGGDFSLDQLAGITDKQIKLLSAQGVQSVAQLRDATASKKDREKLADELQLEDFVVNKWAKMADFLSLDDMTPDVAEFLVVAGINSTQDLASRNPESVAHKLQNLNDKEARIDSVPTRQQLEAWVVAISG